MQPQPNDISVVARNKLKNPLLSVAGEGFPFDNYLHNVVLMPATPEPPVLPQNVDYSSAGEQQLVPKTSFPQREDLYKSEGATGADENSQNQRQDNQPPKQSYFTSILSSLPHLSLSSITGDSSRSQQNQYRPNKAFDTSRQSNPVHGSAQSQTSRPPEYSARAYEYSSELGSPANLADYNTNTLDSSIARNQEQPVHQLAQQQTKQPPPQPPLQPPPVAAGGVIAGSYRLGNHRRLKHSHLPEEILNSSKVPHQPVVPLISFPNQSSSSAPPTIFNPNTQALGPSTAQADQPRTSPPTPPPSTPPPPPPPPMLGGALYSQENPLSNAYTSSPAVSPASAHPVALANFTAPNSIINYQANVFSTPPQSIPLRFPEPATPQNTPADIAFSGFNAYRQQPINPYDSLRRTLHQSGHSSATREANLNPINTTFTTVSAAKVTEKLENFIAEQNDDNLSVKSELSAEVAKITDNIGTGLDKNAPIEEFTEINLNINANQDILDQTSADKYNVLLSDTFSTAKPLDAFTLPSTANFFLDPSTNNNHNNRNTYRNSIFQTSAEPVNNNPFKFTQFTTTSDSASFIQTLNSNTCSETEQPNKTVGSAGIVDLSSQSIWPSSPTEANFVAKNAVYEAPVFSSANFLNPKEIEDLTNFVPSSPSSVYGAPSVDNNSNCQFLVSAQKNFNAVPEPTGSATLGPEQMSFSPLINRVSQDTIPLSLQNLASTEKQMQYRAVYHHWFYCREVESKILWLPFSMHDSLNLEDVHNSNEISPVTKVATDGGRYDVEILRRQRSSVYWPSSASEVRRCSWFYKGSAESRYTPYEESVAARLEEEFKQACMSNNWNRRVDLNNGEYIIFHSSTVQVHYLQATTPELAASWGNNSGSEDNAYLQGNTSRPRVVKRGMDEFNIDDGEPEKVDHLLFLVHGIGSVCDLKFRSVEEVVDEFRSISLQLVQSHYRNSSERGIVNRIEVLPISWHAALHAGIDKKLEVITLGSIPKLRHFTNDTLLDILFYTSPTYCETIMQTVGHELNRLFALFNERNPTFQGNVYLGGHSLGSLIVFDLLCHQKPPLPEETNKPAGDKEDSTNPDSANSKEVPSVPAFKRKLSKQVSYVMGNAGTGQPYINYPQLAFNPSAFFALGSPIGMFVTVRGIDTLGENFVLPTCPAFFNIFHPFDPVAYRIESLINPEAYKYRPMLIPHHKGRKRMHLELKETMARVGADLKQKLLESVKSTWNSVYQLGIFNRQDNKALEEEIEKVVEEQMNNPPPDNMETAANDDTLIDFKIGKLNGGRRIDYVLQEAPFEYINEYLFILTSHVCYWQSEDTMLMILKEIYGSTGIQTDAQLPQQTLSIERVSGSPNNIIAQTGIDSMDSVNQVTAESSTPLSTTSYVKNF